MRTQHISVQPVQFPRTQGTERTGWNKVHQSLTGCQVKSIHATALYQHSQLVKHKSLCNPSALLYMWSEHPQRKWWWASGCPCRAQRLQWLTTAKDAALSSGFPSWRVTVFLKDSTLSISLLMHVLRMLKLLELGLHWQLAKGPHFLWITWSKLQGCCLQYRCSPLNLQDPPWNALS